MLWGWQRRNKQRTFRYFDRWDDNGQYGKCKCWCGGKKMLEEDYENQEVIKILNELNKKEISVCEAYEKIEPYLL